MSKKYRGKKTQTKSQGPDPEDETKFKGQCSDLEFYIFDLWPRASDKFTKTMKYMERYLEATYRNICQTDIMTETLATFSEPYIPTSIPDTGVKSPKTNVDMI